MPVIIYPAKRKGTAWKAAEPWLDEDNYDDNTGNGSAVDDDEHDDDNDEAGRVMGSAVIVRRRRRRRHSRSEEASSSRRTGARNDPAFDFDEAQEDILADRLLSKVKRKVSIGGGTAGPRSPLRSSTGGTSPPTATHSDMTVAAATAPSSFSLEEDSAERLLDKVQQRRVSVLGGRHQPTSPQGRESSDHNHRNDNTRTVTFDEQTLITAKGQPSPSSSSSSSSSSPTRLGGRGRRRRRRSSSEIHANNNNVDSNDRKRAACNATAYLKDPPSNLSFEENPSLSTTAARELSVVVEEEVRQSMPQPRSEKEPPSHAATEETSPAPVNEELLVTARSPAMAINTSEETRQMTSTSNQGAQDVIDETYKNPSPATEADGKSHGIASPSNTTFGETPQPGHCPMDETIATTTTTVQIPPPPKVEMCTTGTAITYPCVPEQVDETRRNATSDEDEGSSMLHNKRRSIRRLAAVTPATRLVLGDVVFVRLEGFLGILFEARVVKKRPRGAVRVQFVFDHVQWDIDARESEVYRVENERRPLDDDDDDDDAHKMMTPGTHVALRSGQPRGQLRDATVVRMHAHRYRVLEHASGLRLWISKSTKKRQPSVDDEYFIIPSASPDEEDDDDREEGPTRRVSKRRRMSASFS